MLPSVICFATLSSSGHQNQLSRSFKFKVPDAIAASVAAAAVVVVVAAAVDVNAVVDVVAASVVAASVVVVVDVNVNVVGVVMFTTSLAAFITL